MVLDASAKWVLATFATLNVFVIHGSAMYHDYSYMHHQGQLDSHMRELEQRRIDELQQIRLQAEKKLFDIQQRKQEQKQRIFEQELAIKQDIENRHVINQSVALKMDVERKLLELEESRRHVVRQTDDALREMEQLRKELGHKTYILQAQTEGKLLDLEKQRRILALQKEEIEKRVSHNLPGQKPVDPQTNSNVPQTEDTQTDQPSPSVTDEDSYTIPERLSGPTSTSTEQPQTKPSLTGFEKLGITTTINPEQSTTTESIRLDQTYMTDTLEQTIGTEAATRLDLDQNVVTSLPDYSGSRRLSPDIEQDLGAHEATTHSSNLQRSTQRQPIIDDESIP